jgi:hypothetical protein
VRHHDFDVSLETISCRLYERVSVSTPHQIRRPRLKDGKFKIQALLCTDLAVDLQRPGR